MIHLHVKGTKQEAEKAASERGITAMFANERLPLIGVPNYWVTDGVTYESYEVVAKWFGETPELIKGKSSFPVGTLLHFTIKGK